MNLGKAIARKEWWVAASAHLLFCDECGKLLTQGFFWTDDDKILCLRCYLLRSEKRGMKHA